MANSWKLKLIRFKRIGFGFFLYISYLFSNERKFIEIFLEHQKAYLIYKSVFLWYNLFQNFRNILILKA